MLVDEVLGPINTREVSEKHLDERQRLQSCLGPLVVEGDLGLVDDVHQLDQPVQGPGLHVTVFLNTFLKD